MAGNSEESSFAYRAQLSSAQPPGATHQFAAGKSDVFNIMNSCMCCTLGGMVATSARSSSISGTFASNFPNVVLAPVYLLHTIGSYNISVNEWRWQHQIFEPIHSQPRPTWPKSERLKELCTLLVFQLGNNTCTDNIYHFHMS